MKAAPSESSRCSWIATIGMLVAIVEFAVAMDSRLKKKGARLSSFNDNSLLFYEIEIGDISEIYNVAWSRAPRHLMVKKLYWEPSPRWE